MTYFVIRGTDCISCETLEEAETQARVLAHGYGANVEIAQKISTVQVRVHFEIVPCKGRDS